MYLTHGCHLRAQPAAVPLEDAQCVLAGGFGVARHLAQHRLLLLHALHPPRLLALQGARHLLAPLLQHLRSLVPALLERGGHVGAGAARGAAAPGGVRRELGQPLHEKDAEILEDLRHTFRAFVREHYPTVQLSDIVKLTASHYFGIVPLHVNRDHQVAYLQTASALISSLGATTSAEKPVKLV